MKQDSSDSLSSDSDSSNASDYKISRRDKKKIYQKKNKQESIKLCTKLRAKSDDSV